MARPLLAVVVGSGVDGWVRHGKFRLDGLGPVGSGTVSCGEVS